VTTPPGRLLLAALLLPVSCIYYNSMYDAEQAYERAEDRRRAGARGEANVWYDSVISKTERVVAKHADSKYAAPAAVLKARAEIARGSRWEPAAATAASVAGLTDDPRLLGIAAGLEGIARRNLGEFAEAERLLTRGLESEPSDEDRALFLFDRGLAHLELGRSDLAAADLEAAGRQERLTREVRIDLARGLSEAGRHEDAVRITGGVIREDRFASFEIGMDEHLDSLAHRAPEALEATLTEQLSESELTATKRALLDYYRGLSREVVGDRDGALAAYDGARAAEGRYAVEADYRAARLRIATAARPADVVETRQGLGRARSIPKPGVSADAARLEALVVEFANLIEALETRGASAAEAALRAAEIAGGQLGARRVARGLYLRYVELAPDSPWRAKAIAGAMLHSEWPAGEWAEDRGAETDARLRTYMAALPATDPYRASVMELPRSVNLDSAYVEAERELRRRLIEIRMLYDTTAVLVAPSDTADDAEPDEDDEVEPDQPDVEF